MCVALATGWSAGAVVRMNVARSSRPGAQEPERLGLDGGRFQAGRISPRITETNVDALFLDCQPWDTPPGAFSLKPGGFFCNLVPTFNQIEKLLICLAARTLPLSKCASCSCVITSPSPPSASTDRHDRPHRLLTFARRIEPSEIRAPISCSKSRVGW